ncbi:MAG: peptidase U32 family protein [Breznakia sp.]
MKNIELLSPVGRIQSAYAAIENGADAIYVGGIKFGARAFANNLSMEELTDVIAYAHLRDVRVYITLNTLLFEYELDECKAYIQQLYHLHVDAIIVQDLGILYYIRKTFPDFEVHASTQMHIYNRSALQFLHQQGVKRAVLARECSLEKIISFQNLPIEKEVFVHGALCISYSGQCLFSSINHARSGNRGKCAQGCRMQYDLYCEKTLLKKDQYLLSPKDLCTHTHIAKLQDAQVDSIKIEGRMKSNEYVAYTTYVYRRKLDNPAYQMSEEEANILKVLFHRKYTLGHAFQASGNQFINEDRPNHEGVVIGSVLYRRGERVYIKLQKELAQFDAIRFLAKHEDGCIVNRLYQNDLLIAKGNVNSVVALDYAKPVEVNCVVVKTKDARIEKELRLSYQKNTRKKALKAVIELHIDQPVKLTIYKQAHQVEVVSESLVERAQSRPLKDLDIQKSLQKTGNTPYEFVNINIIKDEDIFFSLKTLNELRRQALKVYEEQKLSNFHRQQIPFSIQSQKQTLFPPRISAHVENEDQLLACLQYREIVVYTSDKRLYEKYQAQKRVLYETQNVYDKSYKKASCIHDVGGLHKGCDIGYGISIQNSEALYYVSQLRTSYISLGLELRKKDIKAMLSKVKDVSILSQLEFMIYGKIKLMSMQHCVVNHACLQSDKKNCVLCKKQNYYLKNRQGQSFYMRGDDACILHLYSDQPRDEIMHVQSYRALGIQSFHFAFFDESATSVHQIIQKFQKNDQ